MDRAAMLSALSSGPSSPTLAQLLLLFGRGAIGYPNPLMVRGNLMSQGRTSPAVQTPPPSTGNYVTESGTNNYVDQGGSPYVTEG